MAHRTIGQESLAPDGTSRSGAGLERLSSLIDWQPVAALLAPLSVCHTPASRQAANQPWTIYRGGKQSGSIRQGTTSRAGNGRAPSNASTTCSTSPCASRRAARPARPRRSSTASLLTDTIGALLAVIVSDAKQTMGASASHRT